MEYLSKIRSVFSGKPETLYIPEPNLKKLKRNSNKIKKEFRKYEDQTRKSLHVSQELLDTIITI